jgi:hypothetical protein
MTAYKMWKCNGCPEPCVLLFPVDLKPVYCVGIYGGGDLAFWQEVE